MTQARKYIWMRRREKINDYMKKTKNDIETEIAMYTMIRLWISLDMIGKEITNASLYIIK